MTSEVEQDSVTAAPIEAVNRFNEAFALRDVDAIMAAMTEDCVFESTGGRTPRDGWRFEGQEDVQSLWEEFFSGSITSTFTTEEMTATGERCLVRWSYDWENAQG
ncbi:MAG: nuclear transport factor 2 family protein, partial [Chloroflexi bacterium]|nr:nuclear transport factor 2 family protein [Chloroflexota bacterium]